MGLYPRAVALADGTLLVSDVTFNTEGAGIGAIFASRPADQVRRRVVAVSCPGFGAKFVGSPLTPTAVGPPVSAPCASTCGNATYPCTVVAY